MSNVPLFAAFLVAAALAAPAAAGDKWVSPTGDDGNSGDDPDNAYATIQRGVDTVTAGSAVRVLPGTYAGVVVVDPAGVLGAGPRGPAGPFTIRGEGSPAAVVRRPAGLRPLDPLWTTESGNPADPAIWVEGGVAVRIERLEIDGFDDDSAVRSFGVVFKNSTGEILDCAVRRFRNPGNPAAQQGIGIYAFGIGTNLEVTGCALSEIQKAHALFHAGAVGLVRRTRFTGAGPTGVVAQNGIQLAFGGRGAVEGCVFEGFWYTGGGYTAAGVLAYDAGGPVFVENSTLRDCQSAIAWTNPSGGSIAGSEFVGNSISRVASAPNDAAGIALSDVSGTGAGAGLHLVSHNTIARKRGRGIQTNVAAGTFRRNHLHENGADAGAENARDDANGSNKWAGNGWSDLASNASFPNYLVPGLAGEVDVVAVAGDPSFLGPVEHPLPGVDPGPNDLVLADLDGDGDLDAAVANLLDDTVGVLLNGGGGAFGIPVTTPLVAGDGPRALAVGDFVPGGGPDLAVACSLSDSIRVLANGGGGSFSIFSTLALPGTRPVGLAALDADGTLGDDLAIALEGTPLAGGGGAAFAANDGAGFSTAIAALLPAPAGGFLAPKGVATADLDGDGDPDLAFVTGGTLSVPAPVGDTLLYRNGPAAGAFAFEGSLAAPASAARISAGDLDGNGRADLLVSSHSFPVIAASALALFEHDGTPGMSSANFAPAASFGPGGLPGAVAAGELRDDSIPGFLDRRDAVSTILGSGALARFAGYDGSGFGAIVPVAAGTSLAAAGVADLNGDGAGDLLAADYAAGTVALVAARPLALAQRFGAGCPGAGGRVPSIASVGLPELGNLAFAVRLDGAAAGAPAILALWITLEPTPLPGSPCVLYPGFGPPLFLANVTDGTGSAVRPIPVPAVPVYAGALVYGQFVVFGAGGSYLGLFALSDGLRLKLGS